MSCSRCVCPAEPCRADGDPGSLRPARAMPRPSLAHGPGLRRERPGAAKALSPRALTTAACACAALACALVIAPDSRSMRIISDAAVVYVNLAMIFVLMLPTLAVGVGRRRI